jgi:NAD(P)-dependent dehydrogenase (short-subunit alcohol dehydrogenase family)
MAIDGRFGLEGKTAIVTGNGSGLGRAMSLALADAGANIVGAGRRPDPLLETVRMIEAKGRRALAIPTDVTKSDQVNRMVEQAIAEFGRIDILINNAGGGGAGRGKTMPELTDEDWHEGIDTNLTSAFFCSRAIVPHFLERGGGRIINVTSGWGMRARRGEFMYAISKGGVIQLTKTIGMTYARDNIRCTCIAPGSIPKGLDEEVRKQRSQLQPVGRLGYSYEVGPLAVFLASDASDYMTGETVLIDGGAIAGGLVPAGIFPRAEG